jgi:hypothetical protein
MATRIPTVLAVAVLGATVAGALVVSCETQSGPEPIDATKASSVKIDAAVDAGAPDDGSMDATPVPTDGMRDS